MIRIWIAIGLCLGFFLLPGHVQADGSGFDVRVTADRLRRIIRLDGAVPPAPRTRISIPSLPVPHFAEIRDAARTYGIPLELLVALVRAESNFCHLAVSPRGAQGLGQLMPRISRWLKVDDPFDPRENLDGTARYLRGLLDQFGGDGDTSRALAAYNAGPARARRDRRSWPAETRTFVRRVLKYEREYAGLLRQHTN